MEGVKSDHVLPLLKSKQIEKSRKAETIAITSSAQQSVEVQCPSSDRNGHLLPPQPAEPRPSRGSPLAGESIYRPHGQPHFLFVPLPPGPPHGVASVSPGGGPRAVVGRAADGAAGGSLRALAVPAAGPGRAAGKGKACPMRGRARPARCGAGDPAAGAAKMAAEAPGPSWRGGRRESPRG